MAGKITVAQRCSESQEKIANSLPEIVDKVIEKAKSDGSVPHAKFLLEWAELKPAAPKEPESQPAEKVVEADDQDEPGIAEVLLNTLQEMLEQERRVKAEEATRAAAGISVP